MPLPILGPDPEAPFPPASRALRLPEGLLAAGGDLSPTRLLSAYRQGIFPWYSTGQPILWWSPDPRMVFEPARFRLASRFQRQLRHSEWQVRADTAFDHVIAGCASAPRRDQDGTWIVADMMDAYRTLHRLGHAHSIEVFAADELVGGLYGVAVGRMFFGESMFSARSGGSKVALAGLMRLLSAWDWPLVDAQVENEHLVSMGGRQIRRGPFITRVAELAGQPGRIGPWTDAVPGWPASSLGKPLH